jgi:hypothetical protein
MLMQQPSYTSYVPNPYLKANILLSAYTRATMYWSLECELDGTMDRSTASTYYN